MEGGVVRGRGRGGRKGEEEGRVEKRKGGGSGGSLYIAMIRVLVCLEV